MSQEVLIMAEQRRGIIEEPSFSLLSEGGKLNEKLSDSHLLSAVVMGHGLKDLESELGSYGADRVYYFDHPLLENYRPQLYTALIAGWVRERNPVLFLFGATARGSDLAPRIAARLRAGLVTNCVDIIAQGDQLSAVKPILDQYLYQKLVFRNRGLRMATLSPGAMAREDPDITKKAELIKILPEADEENLSVRFIESIKADPKTVGLEEADRVVCGGRGVGKKDFDRIDQLADVLRASVGGTRPMIDWGLLPYERQIGQTGVEVSPSLLVTGGVSGANEFTVGIEGAKRVIAIDTDRKARIFKFADLGIIGDLHKVIPLIIDKVTRYRENKREAE